MRKLLLAVALTLPVASMAYEKVDKEAFFDAGLLVSCVKSNLLSRSDARSVYLSLNKKQQILDFARYSNENIQEKKEILERYGLEGIAEQMSSFNEGKRYGTNIDQCYILWSKYTSSHI